MRRIGLTLAALATFFVVPSAVHAQGSDSTADDNPRYQDHTNYQTSRTIEGQIVKIDAREGYLVLAYKEKNVRFDVHEKVKLKADKNTGLNRKDLRLEDFPVGGRVKLTLRTSDGQLLEMRLRAQKKT
jgi:hypothetical protein